MRKQNHGLYAVAAAIVAVWALAFGVPLQQFAFLGLFLACPLMMVFMMRGMHGSGGGGRIDQRSGDSQTQSEPHGHTTPR